MYVPDSVMLPISYVIENPTSVDYKQTTANFRRLYIIRYRPFEIKSERGNPEFIWLRLLQSQALHPSEDVLLPHSFLMGNQR